MKSVKLAVLAFGCCVCVSSANAASIWIDDVNGNIGLVDITTGAVTNLHNTGQSLTDIAFVGTQMYGTTFSSLYQINTATGAASRVGNYASGNMNALVGSGTSLLSAAVDTTTVYSIANPSTSAATTNFATGLPGTSSGDLAFAGSTLYEAAVASNGNDELVNVNSRSAVGFFTIGGIEQSSVFGLADDGSAMYATQGTNIYTVNLATGALTFDTSYAGHGLGQSFGSAFVSENVGGVPEPSTWALMMLGFAGLGILAYRQPRARSKALPA